ncbi:MAG: hypothetical protein ACYTG0_43955 [Planctomycetota bacterium]|jgi:hypothetical protein
MSKSDESGWLAEILRLTVFTTAKPDLTGLAGAWKAIVDDEPDTVELKPKEHMLRESGSFREATLTFTHVMRRIDWVLGPSESTPNAWDVIGTFADETPPFVELTRKWLAVSPEINRLAFGAVLINPVRDHDEGYTKVSAYLPFDIDLGARNFSYQINRRRASRLGVPGLEINRLSKWACAEQRSAHLSVGDTAKVNDDYPSRFAVRLEVDINTAPEYPKSLKPGNLADLLDECVALGAEIAEKGDIP